MSKVTFLYHPINENKINLVQSFAKVWYEDDPQIPVYDEELEWAKCLINRSHLFQSEYAFDKPSLVGAVHADYQGNIRWLQDGGPHSSTKAKEREEMIAQSYD